MTPSAQSPYTWRAELKSGIAAVWMLDAAGRTVATAGGRTVIDAQRNAIATATDEGAKAFLRQVLPGVAD